MSILAQIKIEQIAARKDRNAELATTLTTLMSEIANVGLNDGKRETTDAEAIAVIKKFLKGVDETIEAQDSYEAQVERLQYLSYLPKQFTEFDILQNVEFLVRNTENPNMGIIMKEFKQHWDGQYDGKALAKIVKEVLARQ